MAEALDPALRLVSLAEFRRQQWGVLLPVGAVAGTGLLLLIGEPNPGVGQIGGVAALIALAAGIAWRDWRRVSATGAAGLAEGAALLEAGRNEEARRFYEAKVPELKTQPAAAAAALLSAGVAALRAGDRAGAAARWAAVEASGWPGAVGHAAELGVRLPNAMALLAAIRGEVEEARRLQKIAMGRCPARLRLGWQVVDVRALIAAGGEADLREAAALLAKIKAAEPGGAGATQRAATLALLGAWLEVRQGRAPDPGLLEAARAAPGGRRWIADAEMAAWMEAEGLP